MITATHKLKGSFEGALAGGGDPASSPLYIFGPFLKLIVGTGVATITFGASIWLAILTVITVSAVYKLVMRWIIDGSGGSGLCEEEFGSWAVKINAGVTIIEYSLTFLVSIAALVTFLSDRFTYLEFDFLGISLRTTTAIFVSILIGFAVNFGPRASAKIFGPATLGVLILLWLMMGSTIWKLGLHLPSLHLAAFNLDNIHFTLGGYARILALMTGIEVFANLVAAYQGSALNRSKQAFNSLLIIMGTTSLTLLIVGPAILELSNPMDESISVFTQTMDKLLPMPLAYLGTAVSVLVLLSAASASVQGIQNLALGLRYRHYIPSWLGSLNQYEAADKAVWIIIITCITCFFLFGTNEETYLALYAAGVFILLSLTSWAASKRLFKQMKHKNEKHSTFNFIGSLIAATLTTLATIVIFEERFTEGAWFYLVLTPFFYIAFTYCRQKLGHPEQINERIGMAITSSRLLGYANEGIHFKNILVPLDQSPTSEFALSCAKQIARNYNGRIHLLTVTSANNEKSENLQGTFIPKSSTQSARTYLYTIKRELNEAEYETSVKVSTGTPAKIIGREAARNIDLIIMTSYGRSLVNRWITSTITTDVIHQTTPPLIVLRPTNEWHSIRTQFKTILVTLDGSKIAEQILPYAKELAYKFSSTVTLLLVPEASDSDELIEKLHIYLREASLGFKRKGIVVNTLIVGSSPSQTILKVSEEINADLVMMVSHGRGGIKRQEYVKLGSVSDSVLQKLNCPLFLVSAK